MSTNLTKREIVLEIYEKTGSAPGSPGEASEGAAKPEGDAGKGKPASKDDVIDAEYEVKE